MNKADGQAAVAEGRAPEIAGALMDEHFESAMDPRVRSRLGDYLVFARCGAMMFADGDDSTAERWLMSALALMYYLGRLDAGEQPTGYGPRLD